MLTVVNPHFPDATPTSFEKYPNSFFIAVITSKSYIMYDFVYFHTFFYAVLLDSSFFYMIRYIICMKMDGMRGSNGKRKERAAIAYEDRN